jgi:2-methylcitrate dehydratase PrpD
VQLLREWIERLAFDGDDIEALTIWASPKVVSHHSNPRPGDIMSAQYSMPFIVALAAYFDPTDPAVFNERVLRDGRILELAQRVCIVRREQAGGTPGVAMALRLRSGKDLDGSLAAFRGCPEDPVTDSDIKAKFDRLTPEFNGGERTALLNALSSLEHCENVRALPLSRKK